MSKFVEQSFCLNHTLTDTCSWITYAHPEKIQEIKINAASLIPANEPELNIGEKPG